MTEETKAAAIYGRVSTRKQAEGGYSLQAQERTGRERAEREGWTLGVGDIYIDAGLSGKDRNRPQLQNLLANADRIDVVIVAALSRLGRNMRETLETFDLFAEAGVTLVSLKENIDTATAAGRFVRNVLLAAAEFERELIAERTSEGSVEARMEGNAPGGRYTPYGFKRGEKPGELLIDEAQATIVRRVYDLYLSGKSQRGIVRILEADKVPPPSKDGEKEKWAQRTVGRFLERPVYYGAVTFKGEVVAEDAHPAIVSKQTWLEVQRLRKGRAVAAGGGRGRKTSAQVVFTEGILRCGECGHARVPRKRKGGPVYVCRGRVDYGPEFCSAKSLKAKDIDPFVLDYLMSHGIDEANSRRDFIARCNLALKESSALREQADAEVARLEAERKRINRAMRTEGIDPARFIDLMDEVEAELKAADAEAERLAKREDELTLQREGFDPETEYLKAMAQLREAVTDDRDPAALQTIQATLHQLFSSFTITELDPGDGHAVLAYVEGNLSEEAQVERFEWVGGSDDISVIAPEGGPERVPLNLPVPDTMRLTA